MFQNGFLAAMSRSEETRNLPLLPWDIIRTRKVMDGIMDFHISHGSAEPLLHEFFPGKLRPDEQDWWDGKHDAYDNTREKKGRGRSRRFKPRFASTVKFTNTGPHDKPENPKEKLSIENPHKPAPMLTPIPQKGESSRASASISNQVSRDPLEMPSSSSSQFQRNESRKYFTDRPDWVV